MFERLHLVQHRLAEGEQRQLVAGRLAVLQLRQPVGDDRAKAITCMIAGEDDARQRLVGELRAQASDERGKPAGESSVRGL